jgi:4-hydroxybenzoate polyprenyltransferase
MIKDLENYKGDWVKQYRTFPVVFGYRLSKILISLSVVLTFLPIYWLINSSLGLMTYYFYFTIPFLLILLILLWQGSSQKRYLWLHNLLKAHILFGVLGIYFIYK